MIPQPAFFAGSTGHGLHSVGTRNAHLDLEPEHDDDANQRSTQARNE